MDFVETSEMLKAIAHPVRLRILWGLMQNECNVGGIVEKLKLPQSTISQHLAVLRIRGIITPRKEGVRTCYTVTNEKVQELMKLFK